jgi:hypothetical protein
VGPHSARQAPPLGYEMGIPLDRDGNAVTTSRGIKTIFGHVDGWSDEEWLTLQLGPVWVISALVGRSRFDELEQAAFWLGVDDAPQESPLGWQLMRAMTRNRQWLLHEFTLDDRSIVSGLNEVASLLERVPPEVSRDARECMLRVGTALARARGPFGQRMSDQDALTLQLVAQLLETAKETVENNPLNAAVAI